MELVQGCASDGACTSGHQMEAGAGVCIRWKCASDGVGTVHQMELVHGVHQMELVQGCASDGAGTGGHQMEAGTGCASDGAGTGVCIRWSWYIGVHQMELVEVCIRWSWYRVCIRWSSYRGVHQMELVQGVHQMELIQRWASDGAGTQVFIRWSW